MGAHMNRLHSLDAKNLNAASHTHTHTTIFSIVNAAQVDAHSRLCSADSQYVCMYVRVNGLWMPMYLFIILV